MSLRFEWVPEKAKSNYKKHGVSFLEAATVFGDPLAGVGDDPDHSETEERYVIIGMSPSFRIAVGVFAEHGDAIRIISARAATKSERKKY